MQKNMIVQVPLAKWTRPRCTCIRFSTLISVLKRASNMIECIHANVAMRTCHLYFHKCNFSHWSIYRKIKHYFSWHTLHAPAAKSLQSCLTLRDPIDGSPPGSPRPCDSPDKNPGVGCHFLLQCMKVKSKSEATQLCPIHSDPRDCSLPGSSVHGIFQARVLEWVAIAFSYG